LTSHIDAVVLVHSACQKITIFSLDGKYLTANEPTKTLRCQLAFVLETAETLISLTFIHLAHVISGETPENPIRNRLLTLRR